MYTQSLDLKNQLKVLIQAKVNEFNNPQLAYVTSEIIKHASLISFNIHASIHRCNVPKSYAEELGDMLEEYVETVELCYRILKLREKQYLI